MNQKLYIITGAPASGKLTITKRVCNEKNKLFHNHLTVDLALSLFPFGTKEYTNLCEKIREFCIEAAFKNGIENLFFTFCYEGEVDIPFLNNLETISNRLNVSVKYVHIFVERDVLMNRVSNNERFKFGKITEAKKLESVLNSWKCEKPIPDRDSTIINNSNLSIDEAVEKLSQIIST